MNSRIPLAYEACAAAIASSWPWSKLPSQLFGRPSVASTIAGGDPAGGGVAENLLIAPVIEPAVGVLPAGRFCASSASIAARLLSERPCESTVSLGHGESVEYSDAPK